MWRTHSACRVGAFADAACLRTSPGVEKSLETARVGACATSPRRARAQRGAVSEYKTEAAAQSPRRIGEHHAIPARVHRKVSLRQGVAQLRVGFHAPPHSAEVRQRLVYPKVHALLLIDRPGQGKVGGHQSAGTGPAIAGDNARAQM